LSLLKKIILSILLIISFNNAFSQKGWGVGASSLYNINQKHFGMSGRLFIPVHEKLWAVPYAYYYFPVRKFSGGLSAMAPFYKYGSLSFYAIASGSFKGSVSVQVNEHEASNKKSYEADGEAGVGVLIGNGCLKGMVEPRYAVLSEDITLRVGLAYFFNDCNAKKRGGSGFMPKKRKTKKAKTEITRKRPICPAYE